MKKEKPTYQELENELSKLKKEIEILKLSEKSDIISEDRHKALIANIGDVIGIMGSDGIMKYKSPNIERWFGWKPEDLVGTDGWETVHPEDIEAIQKEFFTLLEKDNASVTVEYRYKCKDGSFKWIELTAVNCINNSTINGLLLNYHDITERKQAEEKLRKREREYRSTVDGLLVGVVVHSADTRILMSNPEASNILGLTAGQLVGKEVVDPAWMFVYEDLSSMKVGDYPVSKVISSKKPLINYVLGINRPDREYITWVNVNAMPLFSTDGKLEKVIVNFLDITKRKQTEKILQEAHDLLEGRVEERTAQLQDEINERKQAEEIKKESEANLKSLINNRDESIWSIDNNYNYIIFNNFFKEAYFATFNIELKKEMNVLNILTPELREFWKLKYDKALGGERVVFELSNQVENELHFYEVSLNSIISDGKVTGVSGLSVDITERKQAEKVLLESRANMYAIIENTADSIWAINTSYEILYANAIFESAFYTSFGVHLEPGVNIIMALPDTIRSKWKSYYNRAMSNERFSFVDVIDLGNRSIYIEVLMNPIVVDDIVIAASIFGRDITERVLEEKLLKENEARLHELNATKDKFFSIIAHDLKSPFNSILGLSNLLMIQIQEKNHEGIEKYAEIIQKSSHHALDLLTNLLEWSRSQSGRMDFNPEYFDICALVNDVIKVSGDFARQKSIILSTELLHTVIVFADKAMVSTIMRNLISNAIKFTNTSGKILISSEQKQDELIISVSDNGVGIKKEEIENLFRIDKSYSTLGTQKEKGTGLGLILCKEFMEKHGGKIWAESEEGKGSKFKFSMPLKT